MTDKSSPCLFLLLDDDEDDYTLVKGMLHDAFGDQVRLDWFQRDHFSTMMICSGIYDVTLVDYRLGIEDGLDIIRKAKAHCAEQKILLLTGWVDRSIARRATEAGADGCLFKDDLSVTNLRSVLAPYLCISHSSTPV